MAQSIVLAFTGPRRLSQDPSACILPLGLLSMAAVLKRAGHRVQVLHLAALTRPQALRALTQGHPDLVGFSCFTFQREQTLTLARALRKGSISKRPLIILGGPHAGPLAQEILRRCPWIDGVASGEGEQTILEIVNRMDQDQPLAGVAGFTARQGKRLVTGPTRKSIPHLDSLPSVADADLDLQGVQRSFQLRHLVASRGCGAACVFCQAPSLWENKIRRHSIQRLLSDLDYLREHLGLLFVSFRDDTFTASPGFTRALCRALTLRHPHLLWDCQSRVNQVDDETVSLMRRAGCIQIQLGIESGSERMLRKLRKPFRLPQIERAVQACRRAGMMFSFYLISGVPGEQAKDIDATKRLVIHSKPASLIVSRLTAYPNTPLSRGFDPAVWFEEPRESFPLRHDPEALCHHRQLLALTRRVARTEPYQIKELENAAERLDQAAPALLAVAQLQERLGQADQAKQTLRQLLRRFPGYVWAELHLGELLLESGRYSSAQIHLRKVAKAVPRWPYPQNRLGWALLLSGKREKGLAFIEQAQSLDPSTPPPPQPVIRRA